VRHEPVRAWYQPWKRRCSCGCTWYPCPDGATVPPPAVTRSLHLGEDDLEDETRDSAAGHTGEPPPGPRLALVVAIQASEQR
jgi:hypothetical protein